MAKRKKAKTAAKSGKQTKGRKAAAKTAKKTPGRKKKATGRKTRSMVPSLPQRRER